MQSGPLTLSRFLALPLVALLWLYQHTLSPDHGPLRNLFSQGYCRYYPSCSQYAIDALTTTGIVALPTVGWRLMRCHPWSLGGLDPYKPHRHAPNHIR